MTNNSDNAKISDIFKEPENLAELRKKRYLPRYMEYIYITNDKKLMDGYFMDQFEYYNPENITFVIGQLRDYLREKCRVINVELSTPKEHTKDESQQTEFYFLTMENEVIMFYTNKHYFRKFNGDMDAVICIASNKERPFAVREKLEFKINQWFAEKSD